MFKIQIMGGQISSENQNGKFWSLDLGTLFDVSVKLTNMDCGYKTQVIVEGLNYFLWLPGKYDHILKSDQKISFIYEIFMVHGYRQAWVHCFGFTDIITLKTKYEMVLSSNNDSFRHNKDDNECIIVNYKFDHK